MTVILANLIGKHAVLVDENDVGGYIDKLGAYKAVVTNDEVQIERKHENVVNYTFHGITVMCINERPRIKDKSQSFYRRIVIVQFGHCFTGQERREIKDDYVKRREVLEYVLYRVLMTNFYSIKIPAACHMALEDYKIENDPIRQFVGEILPEISWDFAPFAFLYDLYKAWFRKNNPSGTIEGKNKVTKAICKIVDEGNTGWMTLPDNKPVRVKEMMSNPEHLIAEYDLHDWRHKHYVGNDVDKMCSPELNETYRGIQRCVPVANTLQVG